MRGVGAGVGGSNSCPQSSNCDSDGDPNGSGDTVVRGDGGGCNVPGVPGGDCFTGDVGATTTLNCNF